MTVKKTPCGTQFLPHLQKWGTPCSRLVELFIFSGKVRLYSTKNLHQEMNDSSNRKFSTPIYWMPFSSCQGLM